MPSSNFDGAKKLFFTVKTYLSFLNFSFLLNSENAAS